MLAIRLDSPYYRGWEKLLEDTQAGLLPDRDTGGALTPTESIYDISIQDAGGNTTTLEPYRGKSLLIVNVASKCGFTPQYAGLEHLYQTHKDRGFVVLGFPCNQFGAQEPGSAEEIQTFCEVNYGVTFPVMAKIDVNGPDAAPLYRHLKEAAPGVFGSERIKWNFTKFLVSVDGQVLHRYSPRTKPEELAGDVEQALQAGTRKAPIRAE